MSKIKKKRFSKKVIQIEQLALRSLRQELGMTLKEAGKKIGISDKTIGATYKAKIQLERK